VIVLCFSDREINDLIEFVQILENESKKSNIGPGGAAEVQDYIDLLQFLKTLQKLDEGEREAIVAMISQKSKLITQHETYNELVASGDENILLGHAFENLIAGKVKAEALKQGVHLERIEGDGLGVLPNGQKTPQHCDLVFKDENGKLYSKQIKYSDNSKNIQENSKKFFKTHKNKPNDSGYPELDLDNTDIIVPKGLEDQKIKVNFNGKEKVISTKSEIEIGDVKVDAPSVEEMNDFLKKNYEQMKKVNQEKLVNNQKNLLRKSKSLSKKLAKHESKLSEVSNVEDRAKIQMEIDKIQDRIEKNNDLLSDSDLKLKSNSKYVEVKGVLQTIAKQSVAAAIIGGITASVISFDQNHSKYKSGEITIKQFLLTIGADAGKAAATSGAFAGGLGACSLVFQQLATSTSRGLSLTGNILGKVIGPAVLTGAIGLQVRFSLPLLFCKF